MQLKTYRAFTLAEAVEAVKNDLGADAVILHTRTYKRGGLLGIGRRNVVEVIASEAPEVDGADSATDDSARTGERLSPRAAEAERVYRSGSLVVEPRTEPRADVASTPQPEDSEPAQSDNLELDQARTRRLAQAMSVRLERESNARQDVIHAPGDALKPDVPADPGAPRRFVIGSDGELMPEYAVVPPAELNVEHPVSCII